jgi:hypothetical protein
MSFTHTLLTLFHNILEKMLGGGGGLLVIVKITIEITIDTRSIPFLSIYIHPFVITNAFLSLE